MAWTDSSPTSRVFIQAVLNPLTKSAWTTTAPTGYGSLSADTINVSLFNNTTSPDASAAVTSTGYNTGTWVTANEVTGSGIWAAGGRALGTKTYTVTGAGSQTTSSTLGFGAANLAGAGSGTLSNAYGCLVYDVTITAGTVNSQGICFNYFGGSQSVTSGTFTINWSSGIVFEFTN